MINIHDLRNGTRARDLAVLDLLHLQQLGIAPGTAPTSLLRQLWRISQSQVSRRMDAIADLSVYRVEARWGRYLLIELQHQQCARCLDQRTRQQRWDAVRRQLQEVVG